jgi:hypothetical protein
VGSSDLHVFRQIFVEREYGCLDDLADVRLIIDCGANAGYSSGSFCHGSRRRTSSRSSRIEGTFSS